MKINKKSNPFFSIITPVKNDNKNLIKTLSSLKNQKFKNFEHIVVISGTKKKIPKFLKRSKKIKILYGKDKGIYDGINKGIKVAKGEVVGTLNAGDIYTKNALKIISKYFKNKNIDFIFGTVKKDGIKHGYNPEKIFWSFNFYPAHSSGFFIKYAAQKKIGFYSLKYKCSSDYDLFYKMIKKYKMNGLATKKNEIIGQFQLGGFSQQITLLEHIIEETRIRYDNNQNKLIVLIIMILRLIKNFYKLNIIKYFKNEK